MNSLSVLVIDDNQNHYHLVEDMLASLPGQPFISHWCATYEEGKIALLDNTHQVYLLDYQLGDHDGLELLREVFPNGVSVPVILLTGAGHRAVDAEALQMGVADYFDKAELRASLLERGIRYAIERKRVEAELREAYDQVRELEQFKTDVLRVAGHNILSPLAAVTSYLQMLPQQIALPSEHVEYLGTVQDSLTRVRQIMNDILTLERLGSVQVITTEKVSLNRLIREVAGLHDLQAAENDIIFKVEEPASELMVYGNQPLLREATNNLVNNGIKYTPQDGRVTLRLRQESDTAIVEIQDSGYGVPDDQQEQLFNPFFRAESEETRHINGTGLGLHLVKRIIEWHEGHVGFESVRGQGSIFWLRLPLA